MPWLAESQSAVFCYAPKQSFPGAAGVTNLQFPEDGPSCRHNRRSVLICLGPTKRFTLYRLAKTH